MRDKEFEFTDEELQENREYLRLAIMSEIAGHLWSSNERYQIYISDDDAVNRAIEHLPEAEMLATQIPPEDAFKKTGTDR